MRSQLLSTVFVLVHSSVCSSSTPSNATGYVKAPTPSRPEVEIWRTDRRAGRRQRKMCGHRAQSWLRLQCQYSCV